MTKHTDGIEVIKQQQIVNRHNNKTRISKVAIQVDEIGELTTCTDVIHLLNKLGILYEKVQKLSRKMVLTKPIIKHLTGHNTTGKPYLGFG